VTSVWLATRPPQREFPELDEDVRADVAVIGGGIVGLTSAVLLQEAGLRVVLLEANRLGHGVSGHTTAKVTSQHGLIYARLRARFGADGARTYAAANQAGLEWIADRVAADGIECDFRRRPAYAYVTSAARRHKADREAQAAEQAGLPAWLAETTPLPFDVEAAVRFDNQAEFHAGRYLAALADSLAGARIFERSHAVEVSSNGDRTVKTPGGRVTAGHVIVATHYPFLDRSLAFARLTPQRSYAILCRVAGALPEGMFISGDSPTRSVRAVPLDGEERLLVGGEGHKTGTGGDTRVRYQRLEDFARRHWDVRSVDFRWSAQDNVTLDGVPYVGPVTPWDDRVLMATGFGKWGLTGGTAAALILADRVLGHENPWADLFDPSRLSQLASPRLVKENAEVGLRFVGDRLTKPGRRSLDDLRAGEGDIVRHEGERLAAFRDEDGTVTAVSPVCTHRGCQVAFNHAERSWDCPCHGSRFAVDGSVLQGPAVHRLEHRPLEERGGSRSSRRNSA
jgi:glycine/D-amino acid oxidase-like deaminating enzyme/nitrite reductase/ring-hydroxylating ferredoxin subunit